MAAVLGSNAMALLNPKGAFLSDVRREQVSQRRRNTSTGVLSDMEAAYRPAMDRLRDESRSTDLVDRAEANADQRFERGVEAAQHIQAAQGGMTTRQQALAGYQATQAGAANRDARVNVARSDQQDLQEGAREQLEGMEMNMLAQRATQMQHKESLEQQRKQHQDNLALQKREQKSQKKAKKKGFLGSLVGGVAGFALGGPAGAVAGASIGGKI